MIFTYVLTKKNHDSIRGFFLSVNEEGVPVDYKFTEPVKVSRFQKYIFGDTLDKYLKIDVIFDKFLQTIDFEIDFAFFEDEVFLQNDLFDKSMVLYTTDESPLERSGEFEEINEEYFLLQHSFSGNPLKVKIKDKKVLEELSTVLKDDEEKGILHNFDLYEPFIRLKKISEET